MRRNYLQSSLPPDTMLVSTGTMSSVERRRDGRSANVGTLIAVMKIIRGIVRAKGRTVASVERPRDRSEIYKDTVACNLLISKYFLTH